MPPAMRHPVAKQQPRTLIGKVGGHLPSEPPAAPVISTVFPANRPVDLDAGTSSLLSEFGLHQLSIDVARQRLGADRETIRHLIIGHPRG